MRYRKGDGERSSLFTRRALLLGGTQAVLLSALAGRLYQLQVIETQRFATLAEENRINLRLLPPSRGLIFDRSGQPLAINRNNFRAMATSDRGRGVEVLVERLDQVFNLGETEKARLLRELRRSRNAQPVVVRENLGWEEVARLEFNAPDLPGVFIDLGQTRDYPEGELMSHIIGYAGRVADEDLAGRDDPVLQLATLRFGKKGVERSLEDELRGRAGAVQVEVNSVGRVVRELDRTEGQPGANALLTIDLDLQRFVAERVKEHQSGSVVVLDVVTGDVLAMVSMPGFDPNTFARGITQGEWRELLESPERPLNNKSINGVYPPGSTYKMVTALAALESKAIDPWTRLPCMGFIELGNIKFHCWMKGGHGSTNVVEAIAQIKGPMVNGGFGGNNISGLLVQRALGHPSPSRLTVIRKTPGGGQVPIQVDLNRALRDPRERIIVRPSDVLVLQESPDEAIARYFSQTLNFQFVSRIFETSTTSADVLLSAPLPLISGQ
jgi:penicillin-binding protein 2